MSGSIFILTGGTGAGFYSSYFEDYMTVDKHSSNYDGETDAVNHAVQRLKTPAHEKTKAMFLVDSQAAILALYNNSKKSPTQGRTPAIPADQEKRLAEALKTMEQWGFDITTLEVLNIVAKFVEMNNIKTSFKNAVPEPQGVEYSRKKMTEIFLESKYFDIRKATLNDLGLNDKPKLIWNLDETSLSHDPREKHLGLVANINVKLIEPAHSKDIIILKLSPHISHILQPPDLAVFKSVKDEWDRQLVAWQRKNVGKQIPKKEVFRIDWND
ncbi:hypothetical protein ILUMI_18739 [Ignelater luminosus]|uniref:Uncharacterized protein n=1 Tax=Ignelater luminosus TaxID=2038154 RepID=A0A8K0CHM9_IGNLU|nr:hypothetical protein ILUMI_18739 [Ignelater luminosus]